MTTVSLPTYFFVSFYSVQVFVGGFSLGGASGVDEVQPTGDDPSQGSEAGRPDCHEEELQRVLSQTN